jgi:transposase
VPGLGPVWTAGLVAEIGEIGEIPRFPTEASLAQYTGLAWRVRESGEFQSEDTPLTKASNADLRYYLVGAANSVRVHCPEYTTYYQAKFGQSTRHAHKRTFGLIARKLVRLADALLRAGQVYRPPEVRRNQKGRTPPTSRRPDRQRPCRETAAVG